MDNTIVTIGDINYLWGIFLLVASARKAGMKEPFLVGVKRFTPEAKRILGQLGGVEIVELDGVTRSLTCLKANVMLKAGTGYATWADSDAFFTGDASGILAPASPDEIHFRLRSPAEMPAAFKGRTFGEDGSSIPKAVLGAWRRDVAEVAGAAAPEARYATSGSAAFFSLSLARHRRFLETWDALQAKVLPERDVGVVDRSLEFYHQLDESTLNACLNFAPDAPRVQRTFRMDKDRSRLFVHFIARPKPWQGWTARAFRFFGEYVGVVEWAEASGLALPGPVPACLKRSNRLLMRLLVPWATLRPKIARRLARVFKR
ncbi:MAG: hypothetical protein K6F50_07400 [Kiritimatiellae bacterium]|nr:hypothetical protein [Kiritimatiellia bacterium]